MLKKVTIIAGAALAGLIALGPLAFAAPHAELPCKKADRQFTEAVNILNVGGGNLNACNVLDLPRP